MRTGRGKGWRVCWGRMNFCPVLAALADSDQGVLLLWILGGAFASVKAVEGVINIWHRTRKTPPADATYATKAELASYMLRTDHRLDSLDDELGKSLKDLRQTLECELRTLNRSIGQLEGRIAAVAAPTPQPIINRK